MILWFVALALAQPCPDAVPAAAVVRTLESAEALFATMDVPGFIERTDALEAQLPCLDAPLPAPTVARLHRVQGIRAFVDRQEELTSRSFAASRALEPDYRFAEALVPPDHPLRTEYQAFDPGQITYELAPAPKQGRLTFDGRATRQRPVEVPTFLQRLDRGGAVVGTHYLLPDDPLPSWPARKPPHPMQTPLAAVAGSATVLAAGLLTGAALSRGAYNRTPLDTAEGQARLDPLRDRTHGMALGAAVSGAVAVAGGAGLAFVLVR